MKDDAAGGEGTTAHDSQLNTEQMRSPVSERPSRERIRTKRFVEESEEEGAPAARKRQKKNQKSQADKKGAKQRTLRLKDPKAYAKKLENNRKWKAKKKKESPDYADSEKKKKKDWRDKKMEADPDFFKNYSKAWRKRNPGYFKAYQHHRLLRTKKHLKDYFEEIKKEAEKKKKNKTSKRSIDDLSDVFEYALCHDSLLTMGLEEHLHVHQLKESAYNLRSTQVQCNVESF